MEIAVTVHDEMIDGTGFKSAFWPTAAQNQATPLFSTTRILGLGRRKETYKEESKDTEDTVPIEPRFHSSPHAVPRGRKGREQPINTTSLGSPRGLIQ
jgi:hypothetical protein